MGLQVWSRDQKGWVIESKALSSVDLRPVGSGLGRLEGLAFFFFLLRSSLRMLSVRRGAGTKVRFLSQPCSSRSDFLERLYLG